MTIKPCGHRLIVKPYKQIDVDPIKKKHSEFLKTLEIAGNDNLAREELSVDKGIVLSIGPTAWADFGGIPWCKVGDEVIFAKFAGKNITDENNEQLFLLNDDDICAVTKEAE